MLTYIIQLWNGRTFVPLLTFTAPDDQAARQTALAWGYSGLCVRRVV